MESPPTMPAPGEAGKWHIDIKLTPINKVWTLEEVREWIASGYLFWATLPMPIPPSARLRNPDLPEVFPHHIFFKVFQPLPVFVPS